MSVTTSTESAPGRPKAMQSAMSFSRFEPRPPSPLTRSRASTIQGPISPQLHTPDVARQRTELLADGVGKDVFDKSLSLGTENDEVYEREIDHTPSRSFSLAERFEELPIELISLTDRFVESLSAKVHSEPPTIERLSDMFQDFYVRANSTISTHISTLASRLNRESSPAPRQSSSRSSSLNKSKGGKDHADMADIPHIDQQMLTASEVSEKRKARRLLEHKRVALEEAVERRVCEKVYEKVWRHKSTLDEVRDEKLRSKTAALALVGIGLKDLGIEVGDTVAKGEDYVRELLSPARDGLSKMNDERYPLGKLQNLTSAHKAIVDTLSHIHDSSSSADEILPTLIFTLITSPTEGINIISNLSFIQRFRNLAKVDGEAAYCMTNLEAAISFLENVDLSTLREDEAPEGPPKSSRPSSPLNGQPAPISSQDKTRSASIPSPSPSQTRPTLSTEAAASTSSLQLPTLSSSSKPSTPTTQTHQRRLSNLLQPSAKVLATATDGVRNTADQGFKNISSTLDNSFKFLFGKLKEEQLSRATGGSADGEVVVPQTLDDARRLVSQPSILDDGSTISEASSIADASESYDTAVKHEDRLLGLIGGRKMPPPRERSVDSMQSSDSERKRVAFATTGSSSNLAPSSSTPPNALESMKNLGNTLNPLNHLPGIGGFRGFGRAPIAESPPPIAEKPKQLSSSSPVATKVGGDRPAPQIEPPIRRFLEVQSLSELRVGDLPELLKDYKRLAGVLKDMGAV